MLLEKEIELLKELYETSNNYPFKIAFFEKIFEDLTEIEKKVLYLRHGLLDGQSRSYTEVSKEMGCSETWVRTQECKGILKFRNPTKSKKLI